MRWRAMLNRGQRIGLGVLVLGCAGLGAVWGLRSEPPPETEIIAAAAARYVAETGGERTDCAARPADLPGVRLVVVCGTSGGVDWVEAVDARGNPVVPDIAQEGPTT
jgi:hypothetical protein